MQELVKSSRGVPAKHFSDFLSELIEKFQPLKIICFSKQNLCYERRGCFGSNLDEHTHYWLLMITNSKLRIDYEVQDYCNSHFRHGRITFICHSAEAVTEAIGLNSRFFINVFRNGELIYSADGMMCNQSIPEFIPTQAVFKVEKHWKHRMPLAEGFVEGAGFYLDKENYNLSVFMMHQAVEQCCSLLVRVLMGYRADFHNIRRLLSLCACFSKEPFSLFITESVLDARLFDILVKSYSQARYSNSFLVDETDAKLLFMKVQQFMGLVKKLCLAKISELQNDIELYSVGREVADE